jgi:hypothetical protein
MMILAVNHELFHIILSYAQSVWLIYPESGFLSS